MAANSSGMSLTDGIAIYAAIVATVVLFWDIVKFTRTGRPRIKLAVVKNTVYVGNWLDAPLVVGGTPKYLRVTVTNRGDVATTLSNLTLHAFDYPWQRVLKQQAVFNAVANNPNTATPMPCALERNASWDGMVRQEAELVQLAKTKALYFAAHFTHTDKPTYVRVVM